MRPWLAACAVAWLALAVPAQAQNCDRQKLDAGERLHAYLRAYSVDCISKEVESQLERWRIGPVTTEPKRAEANLVQMVPAWRDISLAFEAIAGRADKNPNVREVAKALSERARIAGDALALAVRLQASPDIAAFQGETWLIQPQMVLFESKEPGQPYLPVIDVPVKLNPDCTPNDNPLCPEALKLGRELMLQWRLAARLGAIASGPTIRMAAKQIGEKDALWDRYLYDSKPMMLFDFVFTDIMEGRWRRSDQYPDGVPVPPRNQWFLLHPSFAVEYASAAVDGQQMKPVAYLEVIGVNRWNDKDRWVDAPVLRWLSGASLVVSYADREGVKDTGYGLMITFENVYSVGLTRYGSDNGVFLSLDLANLFRDKLKPQYEAARTKIDALRKVP